MYNNLCQICIDFLNMNVMVVNVTTYYQINGERLQTSLIKLGVWEHRNCIQNNSK